MTKIANYKKFRKHLYMLHFFWTFADYQSAYIGVVSIKKVRNKAKIKELIHSSATPDPGHRIVK